MMTRSQLNGGMWIAYGGGRVSTELMGNEGELDLDGHIHMWISLEQMLNNNDLAKVEKG